MFGVLITFEGGEGTGKSTQIARLADRLVAQSVAHVATREPGGTKQGEALRAMLVTGEVERWSPKAEALLNYAARAEHIRHVIEPALARGDVVLCDRYMDSTRAYQSDAGTALIDALEKSIVGRFRPQLTLIMDIDPEQGLARAKARGDSAEVRFEKKGLSFHRKLREAFHAIAASEPRRCKLIDASQSIAAVEQQVWAHVEALMHGR
jgi:dTMP kinase